MTTESPLPSGRAPDPRNRDAAGNASRPSDAATAPGGAPADAEVLAADILEARDSVHIEWAGPERRRLRLVGPAGADELLPQLEERLAPRGWVRDADGTWKRSRHADLDDHRTLHLCGTCGWRARVPAARTSCAPCFRCRGVVSTRWTALHLCYCCGEVLIEHRQRESEWFCHYCEERIRELNRDAGRYVVPIGPKPVYGAPWVRADAGPVERVVYEARSKEVEAVVRRVEYWGGLIVVKQRIEERFAAPAPWIPIRTWDRRLDVLRDGAGRVREMVTWLEENPVGEDIAASVFSRFGQPRW